MSSASIDHGSVHWLKAGVTSLVWRITPNCHGVARLTSEERDRALPPVTRARLRLHRLFCKYCARYAEQLELLHDASRSLPERLEELPEPVLGMDVRTRLKRALRERVSRVS